MDEVLYRFMFFNLAWWPLVAPGACLHPADDNTKSSQGLLENKPKHPLLSTCRERPSVVLCSNECSLQAKHFLGEGGGIKKSRPYLLSEQFAAGSELFHLAVFPARLAGEKTVVCL